MRRSEIRGLRWEHVDLVRRTAYLPVTKTEPRTVPLSPRALEILRGLPRRIDGLVFPACDIAHQFAAACERAGIENLHFHDLRHEATSRLFERGLGIQEVAAITGHRTWQMLARYTHPKAEDIAAKLAQARLI